MPKFHRKQSKRRTCRMKYKIIKKVAEHNRKLRKEKKKNPSNRKPKDPGVPNSLPFKDDILREAEQRKQRAKDLKEAQRASRMKLQMENRGVNETVQEAASGGTKCEDAPGSVEESALKVVESADIILEVLDARDPLGSRCSEVEEQVILSGKKLVLVLNKIDLIPKKNVDEWLKYLRQSLPTVAFKASTQLQHTNVSQSKIAAIHINESLKSSNRCIGASFLMKVLGNYRRNQNIQTSIKVGVVGFPNVGKISVINSLKHSRPSTVDGTPRLTESGQEVSLDRHITILDSPGVIVAKDSSPTTLALRNAVKVEKLQDVIRPAEEIVQLVGCTQLSLFYTLKEFSSCEELLNMLAKRMGKYKKGGVLNVEVSARRLINDFNCGNIKYNSNPPEQFHPSGYLTSSIISEMGKAFDISSLERLEPNSIFIPDTSSE